MNIYTIYKAENQINGKIYIGFTENFEKRIKEHKKTYKIINKRTTNYTFYKALRKHKWENFTWEIIYQSTNLHHTKNQMETFFIKEYRSYVGFTDCNGYNMTLGGDGFDSETATRNNLNRVKRGIHPFMTRPDGTNLQTDRVKLGIHQYLKREDGTSFSSDITKAGKNPFSKREDGTSIGQETNFKRVEEGTHPFLKREDGTSIGGLTQEKRVEEGTHHFLKREDGTSVGSDMVNNGTHPFLKREDGTSVGSDMVNNGTHPFLKNKNMVSCYDKQGNFIKIFKEIFHSQSGPRESHEWVTVASKEGRKRKLINQNKL